MANFVDFSQAAMVKVYHAWKNGKSKISSVANVVHHRP